MAEISKREGFGDKKTNDNLSRQGGGTLVFQERKIGSWISFTHRHTRAHEIRHAHPRMHARTREHTHTHSTHLVIPIAAVV